MKGKRRKEGFTLAELLIVVAIIAVLVAVSIPIFNSQIEKARKAVDMHTARNIESTLVSSINDGTIEIMNKNDNKLSGVWVLICRDENSWPRDYAPSSKTFKTVFCGAENYISIHGQLITGNWNDYQVDLASVLTVAGLKLDSLKVTSKDSKSGWDWIVIEAGYMNNQIFTRIYSGFSGQTSSAQNLATGSTNIEKMIG